MAEKNVQTPEIKKAQCTFVVWGSFSFKPISTVELTEVKLLSFVNTDVFLQLVIFSKISLSSIFSARNGSEYNGDITPPKAKEKCKSCIKTCPSLPQIRICSAFPAVDTIQKFIGMSFTLNNIPTQEG